MKVSLVQLGAVRNSGHCIVGTYLLALGGLCPQTATPFIQELSPQPSTTSLILSTRKLVLVHRYPPALEALFDAYAYIQKDRMIWIMP